MVSRGPGALNRMNCRPHPWGVSELSARFGRRNRAALGREDALVYRQDFRPEGIQKRPLYGLSIAPDWAHLDPNGR